MQAIAQTWRGSRAILLWMLYAPFLAMRVHFFAKDKSVARGYLASSFQRILKICRIRVVQVNAPKLPDSGYVVCYNETSFADVFAFPTTVLPLVDRVAAAEVYGRIPYGKRACAKLGIELVARGHRASSERLIQRVVDAVQSGESISWGGEGRLSGMDGLRRFKRGACLIAIRAGVPVVPVAFYGGFKALPTMSLRARPGEVLVRFGDPIYPDNYTEDQAREMADHVRTVVEQMYEDLRREAESRDLS